MDQQQTIFDKDFENQIMTRRRDLMPKWLIIYMWAVIAFGIFMLCYAAWQTPTFNANDAMANDPQYGASYRSGTQRGQFIPGILFLLMGGLVWLERKRAIRFNWGVAIFWAVLIIFMVLSSGVRALLIGIMLPFFIPYWIGLFRIQRRWEKEGVRGKIRF